MKCTRRSFIAQSATAGVLALTACGRSDQQDTPADEASAKEKAKKKGIDLGEFKDLELDPTAWKYDEDNDVYYQLGVPYCTKPASESYESLAIFVPGPYLMQDTEKKKPTLVVNPEAKVGRFTPATAPVVMPINSGMLGSQACPTAYSYAGLGTYLSAGCVYVYAGFRGRSSGYESATGEVFSGGAPWPVVDLKAAVRYLRYNSEALPCDTSKVVMFGFSAGGGVGAVVGASGDAELYTPYLEQIGAATHDGEGNAISDTIFGSASWCPLTSFDSADASYEWMMGQYGTEGTRSEGTWTKLFSTDLATDYASYVNAMDFRNEDDEPLTLDETAGEVFTAGGYYDYLLSCIQDAATAFISNTQFPYTYTPQHLINANFAGDPSLQSTAAGASDIEAITADASAQAAGASTGEGTSVVQSVVYNTPTDYVNDLNGDQWWLTYNQRRGSITVASLGDFVRRLKYPAKDTGAFDALDRSTVENQMFGIDDVGSLHFSAMMQERLVAGREQYAAGDGWDESVIQEWDGDLAQVDALESDMATRMKMFNPLYFVSGHYEGFGSAGVAPYWRVNTGLFQTDTSLCTEANLVLALRQYEGVKSVEFNPVWGQGHVLAEASGTAEENFVTWVTNCCAK